MAVDGTRASKACRSAPNDSAGRFFAQIMRQTRGGNAVRNAAHHLQ